jgi:hypothetical protein
MKVTTFDELKSVLPDFDNDKAKVTGKEKVFSASLTEWNRIKNEVDEKTKKPLYRLIGIKNFTHFFIANN